MTQIDRVSLESISPHPDNPNTHSSEFIGTLAANIRRFGLINPIMLMGDPDQEGRYIIVGGEGRFRAVQLLHEQYLDEDWETIAAIVVEESDDFNTWGRRLSENKLRTFNWIAEAIELASMKTDGISTSELAALFGYSETHMKTLTAIGNIPGLKSLAPAGAKDSGAEFTVRLVRDFILPLRIKSGQEQAQGNVPIWDYSEVSLCIDRLVSGEVTPSDLPSYSADVRERIGKALKMGNKGEETPPPPQPQIDYSNAIKRVQREKAALERELAQLRNQQETNHRAHGNEIQSALAKIEALNEKLQSRDRYIKMIEADYEYYQEHNTLREVESERVKILTSDLQRARDGLDRLELHNRELQKKLQRVPEVTQELVDQIEAKIRSQIQSEQLESQANTIKQAVSESLADVESEIEEVLPGAEQPSDEVQTEAESSTGHDRSEFGEWKSGHETARQQYLNQLVSCFGNQYWQRFDDEMKQEFKAGQQEVITEANKIIGCLEGASEALSA